MFRSARELFGRFRRGKPAPSEPSVVNQDILHTETCREAVALWGRSLFLNADRAAARQANYDGSILEAVYKAKFSDQLGSEGTLTGIPQQIMASRDKSGGVESFHFTILQGNVPVNYSVVKRRNEFHANIAYEYPDSQVFVIVGTDASGQLRFDQLSVKSIPSIDKQYNSRGLSLDINTFSSTDEGKEKPIILKQFLGESTADGVFSGRIKATMEYGAVGPNSDVELIDGQEVCAETNGPFWGIYSRNHGITFKLNRDLSHWQTPLAELNPKKDAVLLKGSTEGRAISFPVKTSITSYLEKVLKLKPGRFDLDPTAIPAISSPSAPTSTG